MFDAPCPLSPAHDLARFDCGRSALDDWLRQRARPSDGVTARTYVVCTGGHIAGYYCLAAGSVARARLATARLRGNTPDEVPVIILGRLAVDRRFARHGVGSTMLRDGLGRAVEASRIIGVRAVLVHALDDEAAAFWSGYGFQPSPIDPRTLQLGVEKIVAALT